MKIKIQIKKRSPRDRKLEMIGTFYIAESGDGFKPCEMTIDGKLVDKTIADYLGLLYKDSCRRCSIKNKLGAVKKVLLSLKVLEE